MKSFHYCLKNILSNKFGVLEKASVENYHLVTLKDGDSKQKFVVRNMPSHVVVVKCPTNHGGLFSKNYRKTCDYLIFDSMCNVVILCELKNKTSGKNRSDAVEQIWHTKKLVQYILAGMETHCDVGEISGEIKEHYMMFSAERLKKRHTHSLNEFKKRYYEDKKFTLYYVASSKISYNQIVKAIGCIAVN